MPSSDHVGTPWLLLLSKFLALVKYPSLTIALTIRLYVNDRATAKSKRLPDSDMALARGYWFGVWRGMGARRLRLNHDRIVHFSYNLAALSPVKETPDKGDFQNYLPSSFSNRAIKS